MPLFNFVKNNLSILDVITDYIQLKQIGTYFKGPCPFHSEKEASFTVSPDKQIFYCFGCQAGGDLISFTAKIENLSQLEAVKFLVDKYQLSVPEEIKKQSCKDFLSNVENKDAYFRTCKKFADWANKQLLNTADAKNYLKQRDIDLKEIEYFNIGYLPGGVRFINRLIKEIGKEGVLVKDLVEVGILMEGQSVLYSPFEERIIFPIKDLVGRFCGFGGRIFRQTDQRAKYYNSKESAFFLKGKLLFGLDLAKKEMQKTSTAYLVEGYTDCVAMIKHNYKNTVATLGTACTQEHLKTLSRFIHKLYVLYDGDQAGQKAILRLTQLCWNVNLELQIIKLLPKEDPASFLIENGNLDDLIAASNDIFTFFVETLGHDFYTSSLSEKLVLSEKLIDVISKLDDAFKRELLLQNASRVMQVPFSALRDLLVKRGSRINIMQDEEAEFDQKPISNGKNVSQLEERIFSAIINSVDKPQRLQINKDLVPYFSEYIKLLLQKLDDFYAKTSLKEGFFDGFISFLEDSDKDWVISCSMKYEQEVDENLFEELISHFCKKNWKQIVQDIKVKLSNAKQQGNEQKLKDLFILFTRLKNGFQSRGLI